MRLPAQEDPPCRRLFEIRGRVAELMLMFFLFAQHVFIEGTGKDAGNSEVHQLVLKSFDYALGASDFPIIACVICSGAGYVLYIMSTTRPYPTNNSQLTTLSKGVDHDVWRAYFFTPLFFFFLFSLFFFLSPWSPGPLVPWSSGPVVLWSRGPLVPWSLGLLGPLVRCSTLVPWSSQVYKVTSIPCEAANLDVRYYWW